MAAHPERDDISESERIIRSVSAQEGSVLASSLGRMESHLAASDAEQSDKIEVWGTRIGRTLALALCFAAIVWALVWLFSN